MIIEPADTFLKHGEIMADLARSFIRQSILTKPKIEYKIDNKIRHEDFNTISFFKIVKKYLSKKIRTITAFLAEPKSTH